MAALSAALTVSLFTLGEARAGTATPGMRVVVVELCTAEQEPERVEAALTTPFEKLLLGLPGVDVINSNTGMGGVALEIQFKGGASDDDAATITHLVERSRLPFHSRAIRLDSPNPDRGFSSRADCAATRR